MTTEGDDLNAVCTCGEDEQQGPHLPHRCPGCNGVRTFLPIKCRTCGHE